MAVDGMSWHSRFIILCIFLGSSQCLVSKFPSFELNDAYATLPAWGYINAAGAPFNATGDGKTDNTNAIQSALNTAGGQGGGIVLLPVGNYYVSGSLSVPAHTTLKGVAGNVFRSWGSNSAAAGSTLLAVNKGAPFIRLVGPDSGVDGIQIFYPQQTTTNPPVSYPPAIQGGCPNCVSDNLFVVNTLLVNPFFGIDFATYPCGRHFISKVYGQPLNIGISIDQCYDIGRIEHIHFWPFWTMNANTLLYQNNNAFTFYFARSDWEVVHDVFSWGYHVGITFGTSKSGSTNGQFSNINFDNVDVGLDCYSTQSAGIQISNLNLANAGGGNQRIGILGHPNEGNVRLIVSTASFWGEFNNPVLWQNSDLLSISNANFVSWNGANPAIDIQAGRAMISNSFFEDLIGTAIHIRAGTDRAIITGNELVGNKLIIENARTVNIGNDM